MPLVRRRQLFAAFLAAGLVGLGPCAAMGDAPVHSTSSPLCQTLHESIQPALAGLMKNDGLLETADRAFTAREIDRGSLRGVTQSLAHNLNLVTRLLGQKFPQDADPAMRASQEAMTARLDAVVSAQNDALNVIQGYLQAEETAQAQNESSAVHPVDPGQVGGGFNDDQSLHGDFRDMTDPAKPIVETRVGSPTRFLEIARSQIGELEDSAGIAIMSAVKVCNSPSH